MITRATLIEGLKFYSKMWEEHGMKKTYSYEGIELVETGEARLPEIGDYYIGNITGLVKYCLNQDWEDYFIRTQHASKILVPNKTYEYQGTKLEIAGEYRLPKSGEYYFCCDYKYSQDYVQRTSQDFQSEKCVILKPVETPSVAKQTVIELADNLKLAVFEYELKQAIQKIEKEINDMYASAQDRKLQGDSATWYLQHHKIMGLEMALSIVKGRFISN